MIALDLSSTPFAPIEDPVVATVLGGDAAHVERVIVDGVLRYRRDTDANRRAHLSEAAAPGRSRMIPREA
jgi:cytosine/adenosine deaminase-related metal-dependent hydrolase